METAIVNGDTCRLKATMSAAGYTIDEQDALIAILSSLENNKRPQKAAPVFISC